MYSRCLKSSRNYGRPNVGWAANLATLHETAGRGVEHIVANRALPRIRPARGEGSEAARELHASYKTAASDASRLGLARSRQGSEAEGCFDAAVVGVGGVGDGDESVGGGVALLCACALLLESLAALTPK